MLDGTSIFPVEVEVPEASTSDVVLHYRSHYRCNGVMITRECAQEVGEADEYTNDLELVTCAACTAVQARRKREDIERQRIIDSVRGKGRSIDEIF